MALEALGKNGEAELWRRQISLAERALGVGEFSDPDIMDLGEDDEDDENPTSKPRARDLVNDAAATPASDVAGASSTQDDDESTEAAVVVDGNPGDDQAGQNDMVAAEAAPVDDGLAENGTADETVVADSSSTPQSDEGAPLADRGSADPADTDK